MVYQECAGCAGYCREDDNQFYLNRQKNMKSGKGRGVYQGCADRNEAVTGPGCRQLPAALAFRVAPGKEVT